MLIISSLNVSDFLKDVFLLFFEKIAEFAIILELNGYSGCMEIG